MDTTNIIINISISLVAGGAAGFGLFKLLGKNWMQNWFAKDLKKYEQQLELLKMQKNLQYSNIYTERATIIKDLYVLLAQLIETKQFVKEVKFKDKQQERATYAEYGELLRQLYIYNMQNGIYLPQSTSDKLAAFAEVITKEITLKQYVLGDISDDDIKRISNIPDNDLRIIFRELRVDFQDLLGITEK